MKLFLASNNPEKIEQWKNMLDKSGIELLTPKSLGVDVSIVEDGNLPKDNALKKARAYFCKTGIATIGDDSGIEFDFLNGEPGVKARRWMGRFSDNVSDEEWLDYLMLRIKEVSGDKFGKIRASWALVSSKGEFVKDIILPFKVYDKTFREKVKGDPLFSIAVDIDKNGNEITKEDKFKILKKEFVKWDIESKI